MSNTNSLVDIWDRYQNGVISEKFVPQKETKHGTKPGKGPNNLNSDKNKGIYKQDTTGPNAQEDSLKKPIDPKNAKEEDELYDSDKFSSEKYDESVEKVDSDMINNCMAKKTQFDKLFEMVTGDGDDFSIGNEPEVDMELDALGIDDEGGDGDGEDVTITISSQAVECLREILAQIDGDEEGDDEFGDEDGGDDEFGDDEDDNEDPFGEAVESQDVPDSAGMKLQDKNNKVNAPGYKQSGGKASGKIKKSDDEGSDVSDSDGKKMQDKNNKVKSNKTSTVGKSLFD
jgi:hypothetical protein